MKPRTMPMATSIISIQSQVVHGHVGNSAAVLPMQAHGLNVAAVPTTLLSNHPGFETMRGRVLEPELVGDLLRGVEERGLIVCHVDFRGQRTLALPTLGVETAPGLAQPRTAGMPRSARG